MHDQPAKWMRSRRLICFHDFDALLFATESFVKSCIAAVLIALIAGPGVAQDEFKVVPPPHYRGLVEMADCRSVSCLLAHRKKLPIGEKMTGLVFFSRLMELRPDRQAAEGLLSAIPATTAEQGIFMNFPTWHDEVTKSEHDMVALDRIYSRWPRLVARAALLAPASMRDYVRYLNLAPNDIHSDFTGNAELVCRKRHAAFLQAFNRLPEKEQDFINKHVFAPESCKALFLSEAE